MKRWMQDAVTLVAMAGLCGQGQAQTTSMAMEHHEAKAAVRSTSLVVTVNGKATTLTQEQLAAMPQRALTVRNGHSSAEETYSGVGVNDLLAKLGITVEGAGAKQVYRSYVKAEGTDHYWVLYSASELQAGLRTTDAIVALTLDGKPLDTDGAFKLVVAGEKKPARWVRNLAALTVVTVE